MRLTSEQTAELDATTRTTRRFVSWRRFAQTFYRDEGTALNVDKVQGVGLPVQNCWLGVA